MLIAREFVAYLSRQLVKRLAPAYLETGDPGGLSELINAVISEELEVEDRLNDEVRDLLSQYTDYMRQEGVSYQDMFRKAKNALIRERKVVRASGRDTGDSMKLSRDKITEISHKIIGSLRTSRMVRLRKDQNEIRLQITSGITEILSTEDKADRESRRKIRTLKREVAEGSEEFDLLQRRYYAEELKKLGIDLAK